MKKRNSIILALATSFLLGCGGGGTSSTPVFDTKEKLGKNLFFDENLSLDRKTSCATCHDPDHAFVDARFLKPDVDQSIFMHGALSVGDDDVSLGGRNAPTATYAKFSPEFSKNTKGVYVGGQFQMEEPLH